jgi:hypothetical protein
MTGTEVECDSLRKIKRAEIERDEADANFSRAPEAPDHEIN